MAGQTYQVNYIVNVDATNAQSAINSFKRAVASMDKATKPLLDLQNKVRGLVETMSTLNRGKYSVKIDTRPATQKIGKLIRALQMAKSEVQQLNAMGVTLGATNTRGGTTTTATRTAASTRGNTAIVSTGGSKGASNKSSRSRNTGASANRARAYRSTPYQVPKNLGYKLLGPTPLPNNGGMAIDMLKGMGIAYGIAGIGTLVSNIVEQSVEYDNAMTTVKNILKSHDTGADFGNRFAAMTQTVRDVGMKTKFKVTEVADAAKFLSMAGLDLDAIQQSIRSIADIALVGDTDLGLTADLVTNIMTAYNINPDKMRNAADIMTNTFTMSNTTLTEIAEAYKYAASLLSAGDVPFEEATAAIGVLGDAGIKGSQAGTTMRTIMANIVNPTKKQQAAWNAIGIKLKDSNGKQKDLLDIFKELNNADLGVDAFYKIFHKTAASGAAALAAHVDKWDKIYLENFTSGGLTRQLAEEKQNTIQGLWAQLTSVFTDQGVTAFDSIQGVIKGYLKSAIDWLDPKKNPDAQKVFKRIADTLVEFFEMLKDASKWFIWFFDNFGYFIKLWAKFQIMIWPVVKAVTALKSVFLGLMGLKKVALTISGLSTALFKLGATSGILSKSWLFLGAPKAGKNANRVLSGAAGGAALGVASDGKKGASGAPMTPFGFAAGTSLLPGLSAKQYAKAARGLNLARPHASMQGYFLNNVDNPGREAEVAVWNKGILAEREKEDKAARAQYRRDRKKFNRRVRNMQFKNGAMGMGSMALGMAGVALGANTFMREDKSTYDYLAGGLYTAAGIAATAGPVGLAVGAVLAAGGVIADFAAAAERVAKVGAQLRSFTQSHQLLDGALTSGNTRTEKYLEFVWRKNYDINDLIQRRVELMKELLGIESSQVVTTNDVGNQMFKDMYDKFYSADSPTGSDKAAQKAADLFNHYADQYGIYITKEDGDWTYVDANRNHIKFNNPDGTSDTNDAVMYDVAAAMELLHGQYRSKIIGENQKRAAEMLYGQASAEDIANWQNAFTATYGPNSWGGKTRPNEWNEDTDVAKHWTGEEIAQSYMGSQLLWLSMSQIVTAQNAILDFKKKLENKTLTESDVVNVLRWGDNTILGQTLADYDPGNIAKWFSHLGYQGNGKWQDPTGMNSPEIMAQTTAGQMQRLLEAIQKLGLEADPSTQALQSYAKTILTLAQAFTGQGEELSGSYNGEIKELNGQKWRWNAATKNWELLDDNGQPKRIAENIEEMSNSMYGLLQATNDFNSHFTPPSWWNLPLSEYNYSIVDHAIASTSPINPGTNLSPMQQFARRLGVDYNPVTDSFQRSSNQPRIPIFTTGKESLPKSEDIHFIGPKLPNESKVVAMDSKQFGKAMSNDKKNNSTTTDNTHSYGTSSSDYKSHMKERAVPKQININIQNLMNVDKVDMTNKDNVAVIKRLKQEVAYALVEAASDGTMMLNGLTN